MFHSLTIRAVEIEGEPWFVARDVCEALGMSLKGGAGQWLRHLSDTERMTVPKGLLHGKGMSQASLISESGLYKLVMRSDKPEAKKFQAWVTEVVLPAIRKGSGCYCENCVSLFVQVSVREIPPVPPPGFRSHPIPRRLAPLSSLNRPCSCATRQRRDTPVSHELSLTFETIRITTPKSLLILRGDL